MTSCRLGRSVILLYTMSQIYTPDYAATDFRAHPERYRVGRGEQGVLIAEPYKSEMVPYWRFRTPELAQTSAAVLWWFFTCYLEDGDGVGADLARKWLQMGWTRARRYANHPSGRKYDAEGEVLPLASDRHTSPLAESARIFYGYYRRAMETPEYAHWRRAWREQYG